MTSQIWIEVVTTDGGEAADADAPPEMWELDKFSNRLYLMREMYQNFVRGGRAKSFLSAADKDEESVVCTPCSAGKYQKTSTVCKACPGDWFALSSQTGCTSCPEGWATNAVGPTEIRSELEVQTRSAGR